LVNPGKRKKLSRKKRENEFEEAKETAFRFLSYRSRSVLEVKRKLQEKEFSPHTVTATLSRLKELGYLNDQEFAVTVARSSLKNKQWGPLRIHDALLKKGIERDIIDRTLTELSREFDVTQVARLAFESKFTLEPHQLKEEKTRKKVVSYLKRKGFSWNIIYTLIKSFE
jgi:regulatory protein